MSEGSLVAFVRDSNRIERLFHDPTREEIEAHTELLALPAVTAADLDRFVARVQPGATLRGHSGMNVRVGAHVPPVGGPEIMRELYELLSTLGDPDYSPWQIHVEYETLHPFTDGNGRSGRALWAWQMLRQGRDPFAIDLLRQMYYDALEWGRGRL